MTDQLIFSWNKNNEINLKLLSVLSPEALSVSMSKRGGRNIGQQLIHLINVRITWLEIINKSLAQDTKKIAPENFSEKSMIKAGFSRTGKKFEDFIKISWEKGGKVSGFKTGLLPFITYLVVHEAHHRGNILLSLKLSGIKIDEKTKWDLWEWGK